MGKTLVILEVSRKQDYIFGSRGMKLDENQRRSHQIALVTGSDFFQRAWEPYREEEHLVYAGGGHTVLQFADAEQATAFVSAVTRKALVTYREMELFAKQMPYDPEMTPGENLMHLTALLEKKKALRRASFRRIGFGMEATDAKNAYLPSVKRERMEENPYHMPEVLPPPEGCSYILDFDKISRRSIAVIHIDGNAMGTRIRRIYEEQTEWEGCCRSMRAFSQQIQSDFEAVFLETAEQVAKYRKRCGDDSNEIPLRPVVLAGDDVCFVTDGAIGLECARVFLERLSRRELLGCPYAACAGVSIVQKDAPFRSAYQRAEELCGNAKRFAAQIDPAGSVSAMDWQVEMGQIRGDWESSRRSYEAEDGSRLCLRPVAVVVPEGKESAAESVTHGLRTYAFFKRLCLALRRREAVRGKMFRLMNALRQGTVEAEFELLCTEQEWIKALLPGRQIFAELDGRAYSLLFDAMESREWFVSFDEVRQ